MGQRELSMPRGDIHLPMNPILHDYFWLMWFARTQRWYLRLGRYSGWVDKRYGKLIGWMQLGFTYVQ